jgi:hypothetical protein
VAGQEGDFMLTDAAYRDRGAGLTVRGVDADVAGFAAKRCLKEAVETAPAYYSEHPPIVMHPPG